MAFRGSWAWIGILLAECMAISAVAQIDTVKRQLLHLGYNAFFEGHAPIAAYAFYYFNRPEFYKEEFTLRMAIAPVYFDSELGIAHALGPNTDLGFGVAGGGFANDYNEIRGGKYIPRESFDGHGGGATVSVYHRFNPRQRIPLFGVIRGGAHFVSYADTDDTAPGFEMPGDRGSADFRVGLRLGGKEPVLYPKVAMELAIWAESLNRGNSGSYGFNDDREVNASSQLFYAHAFLAYTIDRGDNFSVSMTGGDSVNADRFSAYRLGGVLHLVAEYPLIIPGYYYQEISASRFLLFNGRYAVALDEKKRWQLTAIAATAVVDYLESQEQSGNWHSGVGGGLIYHSPSEVWKVGLNYGFGIDALRSSGRGAHVLSLAFQFDLEQYLNKRRSLPFWWEVR